MNETKHHTAARQYGCVKCQTVHREDTEPELFRDHILHQSKHGWEYVPTMPPRSAKEFAAEADELANDQARADLLRQRDELLALIEQVPGVHCRISPQGANAVCVSLELSIGWLREAQQAIARATGKEQGV